MPTAVFLCVANSARSQMAEGLAGHMAPVGWTFRSAGTKPGLVNPLAIQTLREIGVDISHHRSKGLDEVALDRADIIVTLCAEEECPLVPPRVRHLHWPLPDPARSSGSEHERLASFRDVRDRLREALPRLWTDDR